MTYKIIDKDKWARREYFDHYYNDIPCTYSLTCDIDITKLIENKENIYASMLYCIMTIVNNHDEFKTTLLNDQIIIYSKMHPCYTIFHDDTKIFSNIWTTYNDNYDDFKKEYDLDKVKYGNIHQMVAKDQIPDNCISISMIPWATFTSFNLNLSKGYNYLLPIFTMGKYYQKDDKVLLPLSIQVHHSVCDGYHVGAFINELQQLIALWKV